MKLLLDECVTRHLKRDLAGHEVHTVEDAGFILIDYSGSHRNVAAVNILDTFYKGR